ncbi:MAG: 50S ribosomal protein L24 [Candidatus Diapherotrites archaeon]|jgi:large subunit ribosomal protein L24|uniref:50S ribosomal protein L24 n=1 Tax=Candidatus Iainarchaeum sp. TaxID=3101447 RepID=A0A8T5GF34_9ARCH|nr:50S ribosomal protein L24 [Candidatus Diapherotrites archaeon]MBT7241600.1 50S ribosomal protein L24 [Candidatus Diapherotrites archaeon]
MTKSSKPRVSRREYLQMDMHIRSKTITGHLNKKLQKELGTRSVSLRKGDIVEIVRGNFKGKEGKIINIQRGIGKIHVEKIIRKKSDGTEYEVAIDPSNIIVVGIEKGDKKRFKTKKKKEGSE